MNQPTFSLIIVRKKIILAASLFTLAFPLGVGGSIIWTSIPRLGVTSERNEAILFVILGLGLITLGVYTSISYLRNSPKIVLQNGILTFGKNESYELKNIKSVKLSGKVPGVLHVPTEGTELQFEGGGKKIIMDELYSNIWKLKSLLDGINPDETIRLVAPDLVTNEKDITWYKGNPLFSFTGVLLWGFICFLALLYLTSKHQDYRVALTFGFLGSFILISVSSTFNYFGISADQLHIRNYHFFWLRKSYQLNQLKEAQVERHTFPVTLRLVGFNYQNKICPATTLTKKSWLELEKALTQKGVTVREKGL